MQQLGVSNQPAATGRLLPQGTSTKWEAPLPHFERVTAEVLTHDLDDAQRLQARWREGLHQCAGGMNTKESASFSCLNRSIRWAACRLRRQQWQACSSAATFPKASSRSCGAGPQTVLASSHLPGYRPYTLALQTPLCTDRLILPRHQAGIDPHSFRSSFGHNTNIWAYRHSDGQRRPWETPSLQTSTLFQPNHTSFFSPHDLGAARRVCKDLPPVAQVAHRCSCSNATVCAEAQTMMERLDAEGKLALQPVKRRWQDGELGIERWR